MLKKAGIVVAAGAATLLAVSPLAFAGDTGDNGKGGDRQSGAANIAEKNSKGFVNVSGNNVDVSPQACGTILSGNNVLSGVLGLAGRDGAAEVENQQDQSINCTNSSGAGDSVQQNSGESEGGGKG